MPLALLLLLLTASAATATEGAEAPRFQAVAGAVAGDPPGENGEASNRPATVLIDTWTGQTWVLVEDGSVEWKPVPFSADRPMRLLPRLDGEPLRLGR